jgi:hypothetical protein
MLLESGSTITYDSPRDFTAFISNNTYAANSMRDGDQFAKKFTNSDQDYLKLLLYGYLNGSLVDSSMLYLADFTHTDSTLDYIVNVTPGFDWQYVELSTNNVDSVVFKLESSDIGAFGMNTPDFFCMDNVGSYPVSDNSLSESKLKVYPNPTADFVYFDNYKDLSELKISVYDLSGRLISQQINLNYINISNLPMGQYMFRIENKDQIQSEIIIKK